VEYSARVATHPLRVLFIAVGSNPFLSTAYLTASSGSIYDVVEINLECSGSEPDLGRGWQNV
jgi:hypothetical protein